MQDWKVPIKLVDVRKTIELESPCTVATRTLTGSTVHKWCAISYFWGKDKWVATEVDLDTNHRAEVGIESCHWGSFLAMLYMCRELGLLYVWIDAICVEQATGPKKTMQLAEMGHYYSHAAKCLVFPDGLNNYTPPTMRGGGIGQWYRRSWTVQEGALTSKRKAFVHAVPEDYLEHLPAEPMASLPGHDNCTRRGTECTGQLGCGIATAYNSTVPSASRVIVVEEALYAGFLDAWYNLMSPLCPLSGNNLYYQGPLQTINANIGNIKRVIGMYKEGPSYIVGESMGRVSRQKEDKVYSIMTILGIELEVEYYGTSEEQSLKLRELVRQAAETVTVPSNLVHLVVANWYDTEDDCKKDCSLPREGSCSSTMLGVHSCVQAVTYTAESSLTVNTLTTRARCKNVTNPKWYPFDKESAGFSKYGRPFVLEWGDRCCKARGVVNEGKVGARKILLLRVAESYTRGFTIVDGRMARNLKKSQDAHVVLAALRDRMGALHKVGILYVPIRKRDSHMPQDMSAPIWEEESHTFCKRS